MMLYGSRETENSLWKDVLPIVSWAAKTPCIQHVAHKVESSGSIAWPDRSSAPWRRITIRSLSRNTTCRLCGGSGVKNDNSRPSLNSSRKRSG